MHGTRVAAPDPGGRDRRRDRAPRFGPRWKPRPRPWCSLRAPAQRPRWLRRRRCGAKPRPGPASPCGGHGRRGIAHPEHVRETHRVRRPGQAHRGMPLGHHGVPLQRDEPRPEVLGGRSRGHGAAVHRGPTRATISRESTWRARPSSCQGCSASAANCRRSRSRSLLVPAEARRPSPRDQFIARLEDWDDMWAARVDDAASRRRVLRYVASATARSARGPARGRSGPTAPSAPCGHRQPGGLHVGAAYSSVRSSSPGLAAGPDVTAAGVMNDVLALARRAR